MQEWAESFYKSMPWINARKAYAAKRRWLCEDCLERGQFVPGVIVHHVRPLTPLNINDNTVTLNEQNFRLLCRDCHAAAHHREHKRRYSVDEQGRVITSSDAPLAAAR